MNKEFRKELLEKLIIDWAIDHNTDGTEHYKVVFELCPKGVVMANEDKEKYEPANFLSYKPATAIECEYYNPWIDSPIQFYNLVEYDGDIDVVVNGVTILMNV